jgi:hypothetical protein
MVNYQPPFWSKIMSSCIVLAERRNCSVRLPPKCMLLITINHSAESAAQSQAQPGKQ